MGLMILESLKLDLSLFPFLDKNCSLLKNSLALKKKIILSSLIKKGLGIAIVSLF